MAVPTPSYRSFPAPHRGVGANGSRSIAICDSGGVSAPDGRGGGAEICTLPERRIYVCKEGFWGTATSQLWLFFNNMAV